MRTLVLIVALCLLAVAYVQAATPTVEDRINATRQQMGYAPRRIDDRLRGAAAACATRADFCLDANAYLALLAAHGYSMGAAHIGYGFGVDEDEVVRGWMGDPWMRLTMFQTGGYSLYNDMGCVVEPINLAGVNVVCFVASEYVPMEATATPGPLIRPAQLTPRPLVTRTPLPGPTRRW